MLSNLTSLKNRLFSSQVTIFMTFGGFGRYVLAVLYEEFSQLQMPARKARFLAFDTEISNYEPINRTPVEDYLVHLEPFDLNDYMKESRNESIKNAVGLGIKNKDRGDKNAPDTLPSSGFVTFYKYDDSLIKPQVLRCIKSIQKENPGDKIKLVLISDMGDAMSCGMSVPFLYRIRKYFQKHKIRVDVFLATSEIYSGLPQSTRGEIERNCVTTGMLWEYAMARRNGITYPGKNGEPHLGMFDDSIADRIYIFSGGPPETPLGSTAVASIMAQCIRTLEITNVGHFLTENNINIHRSLSDEQWQEENKELHPPGLATLGVAGLKADCLPQLYHLYLVRRFLEDITIPIGASDWKSIDKRAMVWFFDNNLNEDEILREFRIEPLALSSRSILQERASRNSGFKFLKELITELDERAVNELEKKINHKAVALIIENSVRQLRRVGEDVLATPRQHMKGALLFYERAASLLSDKLSDVSIQIIKLETDLFEENQQALLRALLEKLDRQSKRLNNHRPAEVSSVETHIQSLLNQLVETVMDIQRDKIIKYNLLLLHTIYQTLYDAVSDLSEKQKHHLFKYKKMLSLVARYSSKIIRDNRSTFTYIHGDFEDLIQVIMEKFYEHFNRGSAQNFIEQLGEVYIKNTTSSDKALMESLQRVVRPDVKAICDCVDDVYCNEPLIAAYLKSCMDRFFLTLRLDRNRLPNMDPNRLNFVVCADRFYAKYKESLLEGFIHIKADNPFNVLLMWHESGFPFNAIHYMGRINQDYKDLHHRGKSSDGHIMKALDRILPFLDA